MPLLTIENLRVEYGLKDRPVVAVRDVSFTMEPGEFIGVVGESGCGKSTLGYAISRLLRPPGRIAGGKVIFNGRDLVSLSNEEMRKIRWSELSLVMQSGMNALNPVLTIFKQFEDTLKVHTSKTRKEIETRVEELLEMVNIDPAFMHSYPHEMSGGMKQRVAIALALTLSPKLVIMDEPTTALDVVVQRSILQSIKQLRQKSEFAVIFISHDLGSVLELADQVAVMYAGQLVELRSSRDILHGARHPYTQALLRCFPDPTDEVIHLAGIPGTPPDLKSPPPGCPFAPRCERAEAICRTDTPTLARLGNGLAACHIAEREEGVRV